MNALKPSELARLGEIRRVGMERCRELCSTLIDAFFADPFTRWFFGGPPEVSAAERWWSFLLETAPPGSEFHAYGDFSGVAIWHPPGAHMASGAEAVGFKTLVNDLLGDRSKIALRVLAGLASRAPSEKHWHLALLGVTAVQRNKGLGARLLVPMLSRCDRTRVSSYLESSNPRNVPFYERAGFRTVGELIYDDDQPPMTLMWRQPQGER